MLRFLTRRGKSANKNDVIKIIENGINLEHIVIDDDFVKNFNSSFNMQQSTNNIRIELLGKPPNYINYDSDTDLDNPDFPVKVGDIVNPAQR